MADTVLPSVRSRIMASVPTRHTRPERLVRSLLHNAGYRFRIQKKDLPGTPDITLPGRKAVIFVHGCFWHQHPGCRYARRPNSNQKYWDKKLDENIVRDRRNVHALKGRGWRVLIVWQCECKNTDALNRRIRKFIQKNTLSIGK